MYTYFLHLEITRNTLRRFSKLKRFQRFPVDITLFGRVLTPDKLVGHFNSDILEILHTFE